MTNEYFVITLRPLEMPEIDMLIKQQEQFYAIPRYEDMPPNVDSVINRHKFIIKGGEVVMHIHYNEN